MSPFRHAIRAAALKDFETELELIERIAVYRAAGFKPIEITRTLRERHGTSDAQCRAAMKRLERVTELLDGEEEPWAALRPGS